MKSFKERSAFVIPPEGLSEVTFSLRKEISSFKHILTLTSVIKVGCKRMTENYMDDFQKQVSVHSGSETKAPAFLS